MKVKEEIATIQWVIQYKHKWKNGRNETRGEGIRRTEWNVINIIWYYTTFQRPGEDKERSITYTVKTSSEPLVSIVLSNRNN